jgi:hypothetical protein
MMRKSHAGMLFVCCLLLVQCGIGRHPIKTESEVGIFRDTRTSAPDIASRNGEVDLFEAAHQVDHRSEPGDNASQEVAIPDTCSPVCADIECGDDGCGGSCGECESAYQCEEGICLAVCPPSSCEVGDKKCVYNGIAYKECLEVPGCPGVGNNWSGAVICPEDLVCKKSIGCACDYGSCESDGNVGDTCGGKLLGPCELWECIEGCCQTAEDCALVGGCFNSLDCVDCIDVASGETYPCDEGGPPEGSVHNLCTPDWCVNGKCWYADKDGWCDDGDPLSIDTCEPETGSCIHCTPKCKYKECGDDGCGGSCGECAEGCVCFLEYQEAWCIGGIECGCIEEGGYIISGDDLSVCCEGLVKVDDEQPASGSYGGCESDSPGRFCAACGDGVCGLEENYCNCNDCPYYWCEESYGSAYCVEPPEDPDAPFCLGDDIPSGFDGCPDGLFCCEEN